MKNKLNKTYEIVIPEGYEIDEIMDFGDGYEEEPIFTEEVKVRFE